MITFYCGVNEEIWNHHPVAPGAFSCVAPCYGTKESTHQVNRVKLPRETSVIQDSGAFSDSWVKRLSFEAALTRQYEHSERYDYASQVSHMASYDLLIDEKWENGHRSKRRWSENDAEAAVIETVKAAEYMAQHAAGGLVLSAQGVSADQYLRCAEQIFPLMNMQRDVFGLGGWCITGKLPKQIMPSFVATMTKVIPAAAQAGVKRVHIWGVLFAPALAELVWWCERHGIQASTDSSGAQTRPIFGQWGYDDWRDNDYQVVPTDIRGLHRARHVELTREWLCRFTQGRTYRHTAALNNLLYGTKD